MLIFLKSLKSRNFSKQVRISLLLALVLIGILGILIFRTRISIISDFKIDMIEVKKIDILYVFSSNLRLSLLNLVLGCISGGLFVLFTVAQNFYSLAVIGNALVLHNRSYLILKLVPHGIIELFVLVLVWTLSITYSIAIYKLLKKVILRDNSVKDLIKNYTGYAIFDVIMIVVLLGLAAVVEYMVSLA